MMLLEDLTGIRASMTRQHASLELIKAVVSLRSVKEACEIEEIDKACNIGYEMHTAAMRLCKPGVSNNILQAYWMVLLHHTEIWYRLPLSFHRTDRRFTIMTTARFFRQAV